MRMTLSILSHPARRNLAARRSVALPASPVLEGLVPADHKGLRTMISPGVLLRIGVFLGVHAGIVLSLVAFF